MAITNVTSETTLAAAKMAPEFKFGAAEITSACPTGYASMFGFGESAVRLTETAGKAVTGCMTTALITGSPLAAGAVGVGIALHTVFSGSSKPSNVR